MTDTSTVTRTEAPGKRPKGKPSSERRARPSATKQDRRPKAAKALGGNGAAGGEHGAAIEAAAELQSMGQVAAAEPQSAIPGPRPELQPEEQPQLTPADLAEILGADLAIIAGPVADVLALINPPEGAIANAAAALALVDAANQPFAAAVLDAGHVPDGRNLMLGLYGLDVWAARFVRYLLRHAFMTLGAERLGAIARSDDAIRPEIFARMGFQLEGVARDYYGEGVSMLIYGLLRAECVWL